MALEANRSTLPPARRIGAAFLLLLGGMAPAAALAAKHTEVDVVVDFTPEGRKLQHPTVDHPAYYLPLPSEFQQLGSPIAGEKEPVRYDVLHFIALQLRAQGYREMSPHPQVNAAGELTYADGTVLRVPPTPAGPSAPVFAADGVPLTLAMLRAPSGPYSALAARDERRTNPKGAPALTRILSSVDPVHGAVLDGMPSMILTIHYGYISPQIDDFGDGRKVFNNRSQMLGLVAGSALDNLSLDFQSEGYEQKAEEERYFVMLTAYDYQPYVQARKKVVLWQAKMSAPFHGLSGFAEVMPVLVTAGAPFFGRETERPKMLVLPVTPEGHVEIGTPTVRDYQDAPSSAAAATSRPP